MVPICYQRYQVLLDSMLCTWSMVTSVTWWLPVVTFSYQRYQVLHDSEYSYLSYLVVACGSYVLPALPGIA